MPNSNTNKRKQLPSPSLLAEYQNIKTESQSSAHANNLPIAIIGTTFIHEIIIHALSKDSITNNIKGLFETARHITQTEKGGLSDVLVFLLGLALLTQSFRFVMKLGLKQTNRLLPHGISTLFTHPPKAFSERKLFKRNDIISQITQYTHLVTTQTKMTNVCFFFVLASTIILPLLTCLFHETPSQSSGTTLSLSMSILGPFIKISPASDTASNLANRINVFSGRIQATYILNFLYRHYNTYYKKARLLTFKKHIETIADSINDIRLISNHNGYVILEHKPKTMTYSKDNIKLKTSMFMEELFRALNTAQIPTYHADSNRLFVGYTTVTQSCIEKAKSHLTSQISSRLERESQQQKQIKQLQSISTLPWDYASTHYYSTQVIKKSTAQRIVSAAAKQQVTLTYHEKTGHLSKTKKSYTTTAREHSQITPHKQNHIDFSNNIHYFSTESSYQPTHQKAYTLTVPWRHTPIFTTVSNSTLEYCRSYIDKKKLLAILARGHFIGNKSSRQSKQGSVGIKTSDTVYKNTRGEIKDANFVIKDKASNIRIFGNYDRTKNLVTFDGPAYGH